MSLRFGRTTPALVLVVGAVAIAGCGSSSGGGSGTGTAGAAAGGQLSASAWSAQIHSIFQEIKGSEAAIKLHHTQPAAWYAFSSKLKQIQGQVAALKPPANIVGVNAAIASGLAPLSSEATTIGNDYKAGNTMGAKQDSVKFVRSLFALLSKLSNALLKASGGGTST